jgi:DNA-directed RNA polymerase alpha subunit
VNLFIKMDQEPQPTEEEKEVDAEVQRVRELLNQSVDELDLSVRAHNCLKAANIKTIGDLVRREESEMLKFRNFGRKSLQELMAVIEERNFSSAWMWIVSSKTLKDKPSVPGGRKLIQTYETPEERI